MTTPTPDTTMHACTFDVAWRGLCGQPASKDRCAKHEAMKCCVCGDPADHECDHAGRFVCGSPLCPKCEGYVDEDKPAGGWGFMNHGHRRIDSPMTTPTEGGTPSEEAMEAAREIAAGIGDVSDGNPRRTAGAMIRGMAQDIDAAFASKVAALESDFVRRNATTEKYIDRLGDAILEVERQDAKVAALEARVAELVAAGKELRDDFADAVAGKREEWQQVGDHPASRFGRDYARMKDTLDRYDAAALAAPVATKKEADDA